MLQKLRKFITGYPDKIGFQFNDEVFLQGLKFSLKEKYPWKSRREMRGFFEKLYTHKTVDSYQKIVEWKTVKHQEQSHIYYSWAVILRSSSLIMFSACLVLFALQQPLLSNVLLVSGIIVLISDVLLSRMAAKSRESWIMITGLLKTMLEQQDQEHEEAA
jgi:hypothetical protein